MVVGDVVNQITGLLSTQVTFQPALGVSVLVTSCITHIYITNGSTTTASMTGTGITMGNLKWFIDNSIYIKYLTTVNGGAFSGIQIK